jgi:hypothetical protein
MGIKEGKEVQKKGIGNISTKRKHKTSKISSKGQPFRYRKPLRHKQTWPK